MYWYISVVVKIGYFNVMTSPFLWAAKVWFCRYLLEESKVKFSLCMPCRHIGGVKVQLHSLLTLVLDGGEWLTLCSGCVTPRKNSGMHWTGGWMAAETVLTFRSRKNLLKNVSNKDVEMFVLNEINLVSLFIRKVINQNKVDVLELSHHIHVF